MLKDPISPSSALMSQPGNPRRPNHRRRNQNSSSNPQAAPGNYGGFPPGFSGPPPGLNAVQPHNFNPPFNESRPQQPRRRPPPHRGRPPKGDRWDKITVKVSSVLFFDFRRFQLIFVIKNFHFYFEIKKIFLGTEGP